MQKAGRRFSCLLVHGLVREKVNCFKISSRRTSRAFQNGPVTFKQETLNAGRSFFPRFFANVFGGVVFYFAITHQNNEREQSQSIAKEIREADRALKTAERAVLEHQFDDCRILVHFAKKTVGVDINDMLRSREAFRVGALKIAVSYQLHLLHPNLMGLSTEIVSSTDLDEREEWVLITHTPDTDAITLKEVESSRNRMMTLFGAIFYYATEWVAVTAPTSQLYKEKEQTISSCEPSLVVFLAIAVPMTHAIVESLEVGVASAVNTKMVDLLHGGLQSIRSEAEPMQHQYIPDSEDCEWIRNTLRARKKKGKNQIGY